MPELPDIELYLSALQPRLVGRTLERVRVGSPFLLRTVDPPLDAFAGREIVGVRRLGKRIVVECAEALFLVVHLMIAGRLKWREPGARIPGRAGLAAFDLAEGTLLLTEAGSKRRASLHTVAGEDGLSALDPGGLEVAGASLEVFRDRLLLENHTLKRALTDPHLFSGIGNAYSDEILHAAMLSPLALTWRLRDDEIERLHAASAKTLRYWTTRLQADAGERFPEKVTPFHPGMAVHGRFGQPCPRCDTPVQRLTYAENEANYCPACQTGGRLLADRALSRLLHEDWPRTIEQLEAFKAVRRS